MAIKNLIQPKRGGTTIHSHLPSEFYHADDEVSGLKDTRETRSQPNDDDVGNYGTGGYYGNTYRPDESNAGINAGTK